MSIDTRAAAGRTVDRIDRELSTCEAGDLLEDELRQAVPDAHGVYRLDIRRYTAALAGEDIERLARFAGWQVHPQQSTWDELVLLRPAQTAAAGAAFDPSPAATGLVASCAQQADELAEVVGRMAKEERATSARRLAVLDMLGKALDELAQQLRTGEVRP